jgi:hypothetical protein
MVDDQVSHLFTVLDRIERKLEGLLAHDLEHANEIRSIKADLEEAKRDLDARMKPLENLIAGWKSASWIVKILIGSIIALSALLTAMAVIKERITW